MKNIFKLSLLPLGLLFSANLFAQNLCSATYVATNSWGNGAQIALNVKNNGAALSSWEVCWTFNGSETIGDLWNGDVTATGNNICVKNKPYNGNVASNGIIDIGFLVNSPSAQVPASFKLNGVACGANGATSSAPVSSASSSSTPVVSSSSSVASSVANNAARWLLETTQSSFNFVTTKNINTAESFNFTQMQGTVSALGAAVLKIPLATISTGNPTRNGRMQSILFESDFLPHLYFTTQLDLTAIDAMPVGSIKNQSLTGNLSLHAVTKALTFDVVIVKHTSSRVSVSPRRPIIINSADFDLNAGVDGLRLAASLTSIGERSPVYFKMFLTRDNPTQVAAITLPSAPSAPVSLAGTVSVATGDSSLVWTDMSNNETGFVVRRKATNGKWTTQAHLTSNNVSFVESLLAAPGTYDYKIIAFNESIPSLSSNLANVSYLAMNSSSSSTPSSTGTSQSSTSSSIASGGTGSSSSNPDGTLVGDVARGSQLWNVRGCVSCHGVDGERNADGSFAYVPINPNREIYRHSQDTQDRTLQEFISLWMPQGNGGSCTGQCAADLESFIRSWRRPSDGIPDNPVSVFSCPSDATSYGQRTLRLLTKDEYQRSVRDLVGYNQDVTSRLPDDFIAGSFKNNNTLNVDKNRYTNYLATAERIADDVATRWNSALSCSPSNSCATTLVDTLAPRIFRRPLTTTERNEYLAVAQGTAAGRTVTEGMKVALAAMLSSPQFLYRSEIGDSQGNGVFKLTGHELATYMSYTFTGTTPSVSLMAAAGRGELDTPTGIRQHATALLNAPNARLLLNDLVNRWLGTEQLEIKDKDGIANFATLAQDMKLELGKNFAHAMLDSSSTFESVYNPNYTHVNQRLASLYGIPYSANGADSDGFARVSTNERGGILTSGAFMSRYATASDANMVTRSVALRRRLMCQDIPEPPSGISLDREALFARDREFFESPTTTQRMMYNRITSGTTCSNCHGEIINPLGGGLENFDALGRVRTADLKGNAIDAVGTFFSPYPQLQFLNDPDRVIHSPEIQFDGARGLTRTIVEDPLVSNIAQSCLATQFVSYSSGVHSIFLIDSTRDVGYARISKAEEDAYRCDINGLTDVLVTQGPRAMLEELPALNSVMYRQEWAR